MNKARVVYLVMACLLLMGSAASCMTIGEAKSADNGTPVSVTGCVTYVEPGECYIESLNKSAGIRVQGISVEPAIGDIIGLTGIKQSASNGEAVITASAISPVGADTIQPISMANKWVGGANIGADTSILDYKKACVPPGTIPEYFWTQAGGANNTGLLIKAFGKVTAVYSTPATTSAPTYNWFFIDDGSGVVSDLGDTGVLVMSDAEVNVGDYVSVTGVSTVDQAFETPLRVVRAIITPNASSVKILKKPEPKFPMSDEFDGPVLNPMWITCFASGSSISLIDNPGMLTMNVHTTQESHFCVALMLPVPGDWDMEMKIHPIFTFIEQQIEFQLYNPHKIGLEQDYQSLVSLIPTCDNNIGIANTTVCFPKESPIYVSFKKRGSSVDVTVTDGTTSYSPSINPIICIPPGNCLRINGIGYNTSSFTATIDYVRFTRVTQ